MENVKEETLLGSFFIFELAAVKYDPKYYQPRPQRRSAVNEVEILYDCLLINPGNSTP